MATRTPVKATLEDLLNLAADAVSAVGVGGDGWVPPFLEDIDEVSASACPSDETVEAILQFAAILQQEGFGAVPQVAALNARLVEHSAAIINDTCGEGTVVMSQDGGRFRLGDVTLRLNGLEPPVEE